MCMGRRKREEDAEVFIATASNLILEQVKRHSSLKDVNKEACCQEDVNSM